MSRQPVLYVSHGSPTFAVDPGTAGPALTALGLRLPRPEAVLIVSPHWMTREPHVGTAAAPATVHDFGGFPAELYQLDYPAPGHPGLAERTLEVLRAGGWAAAADPQRGLDHGAWVPLMYLFPQADVPVFQVSLPARLDGARAYALGQALSPLADEGVLIVGSGSLTHNLYEARFDAPGAAAEPYVTVFAQWVQAALMDRDHQRLQHILALAPEALRAHPTPEHLWPLLVAAGAAGVEVPVTPIEGGVTHGILVMDAFCWSAGATQIDG